MHYVRYTALLSVTLCACGTDLMRTLPEVAAPTSPSPSPSPRQSTGGSSTAGDTTTQLPTTGLVDDFKDGNDVAEGWGKWHTYGGGASSPSDEQHSAIFTAPGFADYGAQLTYSADSGDYSYSQLAIVFDANQTLHDNTALKFHLKGTGPGVVGLYLVTRLATSSNNFATYGVSLGVAPGDWEEFDIELNDLQGSGSPPFSLADSLLPANFQGFKWNVSKPNGSAQIQSKTLLLDDVTLHD